MPPWIDPAVTLSRSNPMSEPVQEKTLLSAAIVAPESRRRTSYDSIVKKERSRDSLLSHTEESQVFSKVRSADHVASRSSHGGLFIRRPLTALVVCFTAWKILLLIVAVLSPGPSYDTSTKVLLAQHRHDHANGPSIGQFTITSSSIADPATDPLDLAWYISSRGDRQPYGSASSAGLESVDPLHFGLDELTARLALRLIKWDAIYFVSIGKRGRVYEQEWAFGWGCALKYVAERVILFDDPLFNVAYIGIIISNSCHLLSVIVLYYLALAVAPTMSAGSKTRLAFITAALHIFSPASFFLFAPYSEAPFSLASFLGHFAFAKSVADDRHRPLSCDMWLLLSGTFFGLSTLVRNNGVINGLIPFASMLLQLSRFPRLHFRKFACTILAGLLIGLGMLYPQYLAYVEYCIEKAPSLQIDDGSPPVPSPDWCHYRLPFIYAHVQSRYWNVGFLRYWLLSNVGLFAIAAPTLVLLSASAIDALRGKLYSTRLETGNNISFVKGASGRRPGLIRTVSDHVTTMIRKITDDSRSNTAFAPATFALSQLLLAFLALTTFHVQIITRLASGSPLWYLWLGGLVADSAATGLARMPTDLKKTNRVHLEAKTESDEDTDSSDDERDIEERDGRPSTASEKFVRYMVCYGLVQGALFAAFLPPA